MGAWKQSHSTVNHSSVTRTVCLLVWIRKAGDNRTLPPSPPGAAADAGGAGFGRILTLLASPGSPGFPLQALGRVVSGGVFWSTDAVEETGTPLH